MKALMRLVLIVALIAVAWSYTTVFAQDKPASVAPKYDVATEVTVKGTVDEVKDRDCPVSRGMGNHIFLKLADGKIMQVHVAATKFMKSYELGFNKGDQLEVTGSKVTFEGAETILAREIKRGDDIMQFRDKNGKPVW